MIGKVVGGFSNDWKNIAMIFGQGLTLDAWLRGQASRVKCLPRTEPEALVRGPRSFGHGRDFVFAAAFFMNRWLFSAFRYAFALASTMSVVAALADT